MSRRCVFTTVVCEAGTQDDRAEHASSAVLWPNQRCAIKKALTPIVILWRAVRRRDYPPLDSVSVDTQFPGLPTRRNLMARKKNRRKLQKLVDASPALSPRMIAETAAVHAVLLVAMLIFFKGKKGSPVPLRRPSTRPNQRCAFKCPCHLFEPRVELLPKKRPDSFLTLRRLSTRPTTTLRRVGVIYLFPTRSLPHDLATDLSLPLKIRGEPRLASGVAACM